MIHTRNHVNFHTFSHIASLFLILLFNKLVSSVVYLPFRLSVFHHYNHRTCLYRIKWLWTNRHHRHHQKSERTHVLSNTRPGCDVPMAATVRVLGPIFKSDQNHLFQMKHPKRIRFWGHRSHTNPPFKGAVKEDDVYTYTHISCIQSERVVHKPHTPRTYHVYYYCILLVLHS